MIKITNHNRGHSSYSTPEGVLCKDAESTNLLTKFREHGYNAFKSWLSIKSNVNKIDFESPGYKEILGDSKGSKLKNSFLKRMAILPVKKPQVKAKPPPEKKIEKKIEMKKAVERESESESESTGLQVFNLNPQKIREIFECNCTDEIIGRGISGISEFIIKEILTNHDGDLLVKNTDSEFGCLEYMNSGGVECKDQGFEKLLEICRPIYTQMNKDYIEANNSEYYTLKKLWMACSAVEFDVKEKRDTGDGGQDHMMKINLLSYFIYTD